MFHVNDNRLRVTKSAASQTTHKFEQIADNTLNPGRLSLIPHKYSKKSKVLIICGPTATGKTWFGLEMAKKFDGEIISADSRQVYTGKNLVHGKDLPVNLKPQVSNLKWRDRYLKYYEVNSAKIWLYDIVEQNELFSVALWNECAQIVIEDILSRQKLPIVVGGTGLYLKSLSQSLSQISIPPDPILRKKLAGKSPSYLFNYLRGIDKDRAEKMNKSDRLNPRRLIRAIEIAQSQKSQKDTPFHSTERSILNKLQIGLTAPRDELYHRIDLRVEERIAAGAAGEDPILSAHPERWKQMEHRIARQQLTWFKKQPGVAWFDITWSSWKPAAEKLVKSWYN